MLVVIFVYPDHRERWTTDWFLVARLLKEPTSLQISWLVPSDICHVESGVAGASEQWQRWSWGGINRGDEICPQVLNLC